MEVKQRKRTNGIIITNNSYYLNCIIALIDLHVFTIVTLIIIPIHHGYAKHILNHLGCSFSVRSTLASFRPRANKPMVGQYPHPPTTPPTPQVDSATQPSLLIRSRKVLH